MFSDQRLWNAALRVDMQSSRRSLFGIIVAYMSDIALGQQTRTFVLSGEGTGTLRKKL